MTSRPFNTSTKAPTSVKLRGLQASKKVTRQLEVDSRRMEDRLRELKVAMNREKEERGSRGGSSLGIWASGQPGAVTTHANEVTKKKKSLAPPDRTAKPKSGTKGRKIKVLKDTPIEVPQRPKFKLNTSGGDTRRSFKGPACGQCEEKAVALTCMECGENYCTGCYARFHMKGALKSHRSIPYQSPASSSSESLPIAYENGYNDLRPDDSRSLASKPSVNGRKSSMGVDCHSPRDQGKVVRVIVKSPAPTTTGGALLQGDYDEQESSASFAAALAEWRQTKKTEGTEGASQAAPSTPRGTTTSTSEGTSTTNGDISPRQIPEITFKENSSLSYADRLLLKKHRRTELPDAPSPNLMGNDVAKTTKQPVNAWKKDGREEGKAGVSGSQPLVNGDIGDIDDAELKDEHQRYVNIFAKRVSPEAPYNEPRPESVLAISEFTEDDDNLEVSSAYSVQEGPDSIPVIEQPDSTQLSDNQSKPQSAKKPTKPSQEIKEVPKSKLPNNSSAQKPSAKTPSSAKAPVTPSPKTKDSLRLSSGSRASSKSAPANKQRTNQSEVQAHTPVGLQSEGKATRDLSGKRSDSSKASVRLQSMAGNPAKMRPKSKAPTARSEDRRMDSDECNTLVTDRPVSVGLTSRPSDELKQVSQQRQQSQHQYKEGLGEFFTAGITGEKKSESSEQPNNPGPRSSATPSKELPEVTFQASSVWRPDSSLAATSDEAQQIPYTPSPPPPKSSSAKCSAKTRQMVSPAKQVDRNPETGSPIPEGGDPCKRQSKTRGGAMGSTNVGMTSRGREGSSRASDLPDRSCSRIEVDGDDMAGYDEDEAQTHRDISAADRETLEQLTWELASQEGRITAEGRITSMSMLEDEDNQEFGHFSHDAELGILQDDGHGSGLSTPCEVMMERDELSEEDLQGDFEDDQQYKDEVEALRS